MRSLFWVGLLFLIFFIGGCSNSIDEAGKKASSENELFVSAAASLSEALVKIVEAYKKEHPEVSITTNIGGSGKLAQQIEQGAPVDVFLSADQEWMNDLSKQDLILPESIIYFAKNKLVLITQKNTHFTIHSLADLTNEKIEQIAIGNPGSVPAGKYTEEVLRNSELRETLSDKFIYAKDVRQALTYVETGNTEAGFVYITDVRQSDMVEVTVEIDDQLHENIIYPAAVVSSSQNIQQAEEFMSFLQTNEVKTILEDFGFYTN